MPNTCPRGVFKLSLETRHDKSLLMFPRDTTGHVSDIDVPP